MKWLPKLTLALILISGATPVWATVADLNSTYNLSTFSETELTDLDVSDSVTSSTANARLAVFTATVGNTTGAQAQVTLKITRDDVQTATKTLLIPTGTSTIQLISEETGLSVGSHTWEAFVSGTRLPLSFTTATTLEVVGYTTVAGLGLLDGSGTANRLTKWSDTDSLTNSLLNDDGSSVWQTSGSLVLGSASADGVANLVGPFGLDHSRTGAAPSGANALARSALSWGQSSATGSDSLYGHLWTSAFAGTGTAPALEIGHDFGTTLNSTSTAVPDLIGAHFYLSTGASQSTGSFEDVSTLAISRPAGSGNIVYTGDFNQLYINDSNAAGILSGPTTTRYAIQQVGTGDINKFNGPLHISAGTSAAPGLASILDTSDGLQLGDGTAIFYFDGQDALFTSASGVALGSDSQCYFLGNSADVRFCRDSATSAAFTQDNLLIDDQLELRLGEPNAAGTDYVSFKAPATLAASTNYTWPSDDGDANQVLSTDGSGVLDWVADDDTPDAGDFTNLALSGDISSSALVTTIGNDKVLEAHLKAVDAAGDEECLTYESTVGDFEWQSCGAGSGYATVDDEDTPLTQRTTLNFEGAGVTCADDTDQTTCTIPGGSTGKPWEKFTAPQAFLPAASYATQDTRNTHPVLDFDAAADECAYFGGYLNSTYAGGGLNVVLGWMATSATTGATGWLVSIEAHPDDALDLDADSFVTDNSASATTASAAGEVQYTTIAFTDGADMDSLAAGESYRLRVCRDGDGSVVTDDMTGDAELYKVIVTEP